MRREKRKRVIKPRDCSSLRRAGCGGGVDLRALIGEHPQAYAAGGEVLHGADQMGEVAAVTVEFPDHEHVALTGMGSVRNKRWF